MVARSHRSHILYCTMNFRVFSALCLLGVLAAVGVAHAQLSPAEAAGLTTLISAWSHKPTGWDASKIDTACTWQGVVCFNNSIQSIDITNAGVVGTLPSIDAFPNMKSFIARNNTLSGSLPANITTSLVTLDLSSNSFSGNLPAEWSALQLTALYLNNNKLSGCVPSTWPGGMQYSLSPEFGEGCNLSDNDWSCANANCTIGAPLMCQERADTTPMCPKTPFVAHMTPVQIVGICVGIAVFIFVIAFLVRCMVFNKRRAEYQGI